MKIIALLLPFLSCSAFALSPCPPGFKGQLRTIGIYQAGPQVAKTAELMPLHFKFLAEQMDKGEILFAGPLTVDGKPVNKAVGIYKSTALDVVKALIAKDPLIAQKAYTPELYNWLQCERNPAEKTK